MLLIDLGFYFYYFDRRFGCCLLTLFRKLIWNFLLFQKQNFNTHDCGMYVIKHMFTNTSSRHLPLLVINFFELNTNFHIICLNYFLITCLIICRRAGRNVYGTSWQQVQCFQRIMINIRELLKLLETFHYRYIFGHSKISIKE